MADDQPTQERWRPVVGYEGLYEVSDHGLVRSVERWVQHRGRHWHPYKSVVLAPHLDPKGYKRVKLSRQDDDRNRLVHQLVAEAFIGPRPEGMVTRHLNGDNVDNRPQNLAYGTHAENNADLVRHGTHWNAQKTRCNRGHRLVSPNLRNHKNRLCKACHRAREDHKRHPYLTVQEHADRQYARIMGAARAA